MYMRRPFWVGAMILGSLSFGGCIDNLDEHGMTSIDDAVTSTNVPPPDPQVVGVGTCNQIVWTGTAFYADSSETQLIGECSITCAQWIQGTIQTPLPGDGASCQGTNSGFEVKVFEQCTGCRF